MKRLAALTGTLLTLAAGEARAEAVFYSLAIGYNGVPAGADAALRPLQYADDDAASFHRLARTLSRRAHLLALLDVETQGRFPGLAAETRPPSLRALEDAIDGLNRELDAARRAGDEPTVLVFYSGHGTRGDDGRGALTLLDGAITQELLYDRLLAPLRARYVHLFVDACHAESVVRPRDLQAQSVDVAPGALAAYLANTTLARFPHVGAIVASTSTAQAHEWDTYQAGVFTHELLSGLRGAADVDGNRRIEYSELAAFLGAANREVDDPRARIRTVVKPPALDPRTPILDLRAARPAAWLKGRAAALAPFHVESARGPRLVDLKAEPGFSVGLLVPAGEPLTIRSGDREAEITLAHGEVAALEALPFRPAATRPRDAVASALRRGLFAAHFGPAYYRGFVDRQSDLIPVELPADAPAEEAPPARRGAAVSWAAAGALAIAAGVFGVMAFDARSEYRATSYERDAALARQRYERNRGIAAGAAGAALVAGAVGAWLWLRER